jgi:hypothetical protein
MTSQLNHYIIRQRQLELTARAEHARLAARAPRAKASAPHRLLAGLLALKPVRASRHTSDLNPGGGRTRIAQAAWDGLVSGTSMTQEISK